MDDFKSAADMANYLLILMENYTAYMEYFEWRKDGWARIWQHPQQGFNTFVLVSVKICEMKLLLLKYC